MKLLPLIAAAGLAFLTPTAASAAVAPAEAPISATSTVAQTHVRVSVGDQRRHTTRRHYGRRGHNARRAYWRRDCRTTWRRGHRVRVCNRVRGWR